MLQYFLRQETWWQCLWISAIMDIKGFLNQAKTDKGALGDLHVLRFYSSYVIISGRKAIEATDPHMEYCPLASYLYDGIKRLKDFDIEVVKKVIKKIVERKISEFGFFTENRKFFSSAITIPYGASEILMYAMRKKIIDAAVIVCDGAGTVIVNRPETIQGIGARMNGLFYTSPIGRTRERLESAGCKILFPDAAIDQVKGVEKAAKLGYKNIAVTINALMDEDFKELEKIEEKYNVSVTSLTICTTGATEEEILEIEKYSDIVWSCASEGVREIIGKKAIVQFSRKIPVFVLTKKGLDLVSGYSARSDIIKNLDMRKQYFIAYNGRGDKIQVGDFDAWLTESKLPVRDKKEPKLIQYIPVQGKIRYSV